jgi:putative tricarboxylic transport membrane protein
MRPAMVPGLFAERWLFFAEAKRTVTLYYGRWAMTDDQSTQTAWAPERGIDIAAGTPPGGGLDRVARALVEVISEANLLDVSVSVLNVPGDGARRVWGHLDRHPGEGHLVSISSPNLTTDHLVGLAAFDHSRYVPIAILLTEYIAFAVSADSPLRSGADLFEQLASDPAGVTVALSTALGNPNHIAVAKVTRSAGGDINAPRIRVFDTALDAVADVVDVHADVGAVTAASVVKELEAGKVRLVAISSPKRLPAPFADVPTWTEQSVDCVVGAWRGVTGPSGISPRQVVFWERLLADVTKDARWQPALARHCWSPMFLDGPKMHAYLAREYDEMRELLGELGLLRPA